MERLQHGYNFCYIIIIVLLYFMFIAFLSKISQLYLLRMRRIHLIYTGWFCYQGPYLRAGLNHTPPPSNTVFFQNILTTLELIKTSIYTHKKQNESFRICLIYNVGIADFNKKICDEILGEFECQYDAHFSFIYRYLLRRNSISICSSFTVQNYSWRRELV